MAKYSLKWEIFTYISKETNYRLLTLFKASVLRLTYKKKITIKIFLQSKQVNDSICTKSCIYQLQRPEGNKGYTRQTG